MRPTVQEQLLGIGRLIDELAVAHATGPGSADLASATSKQVKRFAASVERRPLFLRWDNITMTALLDESSSSIPDALRRSEIEGRLAEVSAATWATDEAQNDELRQLMIAVIDALPQDTTGDHVRRELADHLRARAAANPALHKDPELPWEAPTDHQTTEKATL